MSKLGTCSRKIIFSEIERTKCNRKQCEGFSNDFKKTGQFQRRSHLLNERTNCINIYRRAWFGGNTYELNMKNNYFNLV